MLLSKAVVICKHINENTLEVRMKSLKGTKTAENLLKSFAGESQARMRYNYYASIAKKEGYIQMAEIFEETAKNEKEHAKRFFKFLNEDMKGEMLEIQASYPIGMGTTVENLRMSAEGEHEEWTELYPMFADVADEEGFKEIAVVYRKIADVEKRHEARFNKLADNIMNSTVFSKEMEVLWKCGNCGYIHEGVDAPKLCPACAHPQSHFEVFVETY
jgi:rubrerythrin